MNDITTRPLYTSQDLIRWKDFEGYANHFYLDGAGYVTIGIGCVIPNAGAASQLNMFFRSTNTKCKAIDEITEFNLIKECPAGKSLNYYSNFCKLYMSETDLMKLFELRLSLVEDGLRPHFKNFQILPNEVREVLKDMAFNLGITGLFTKFPKFVDFIRDGKFTQAAAESERKGIQDKRNIWVKETLLSL